jgi:hypothetical protein
LLKRATDLVMLGQVEQIRVFLERARQVVSTAHRRVILGETVPNEDKLFSIFEPHTQLYRRGKAGQPNQFGLIFDNLHMRGDQNLHEMFCRVVDNSLAGEVLRVIHVACLVIACYISPRAAVKM